MLANGNENSSSSETSGLGTHLILSLQHTWWIWLLIKHKEIFISAHFYFWLHLDSPLAIVRFSTNIEWWSILHVLLSFYVSMIYFACVMSYIFAIRKRVMIITHSYTLSLKLCLNYLKSYFKHDILQMICTKFVPIVSILFSIKENSLV